MSSPIKTAVLGASGYTGQELVRLLLRHEGAKLVAVTSRSSAGQRLEEVIPRLGQVSEELPRFIEPEMDQVVASGANVAFLALPHGKAARYARPLVEAGLTVIDLSADFRLRDAAVYEEFYHKPPEVPELLEEAVYGLPEVYGEEIKKARLIASPGCYPTSILLPLLPLLREGAISPVGLTASCCSGVSGAGRRADVQLLFVECNESVRAYGLPKHRHLSEIEQELSLVAGQPVTMTFIPHLVPVNRGICSTIVAGLTADFETISQIYHREYQTSPFVRLLGAGGCADTKNVTRTNVLELGWHHDARTGRLLLTSAEDNLVKGAAGQAIQAFNVRFGFSESEGLRQA